jgi:hypothetical protein
MWSAASCGSRSATPSRSRRTCVGEGLRRADSAQARQRAPTERRATRSERKQQREQCFRNCAHEIGRNQLEAWQRIV